MMAPLFKFGAFGFGSSLVVALVIGISFGFFLERGGLGNARKLAAQFYLTDLTVFKVMFTAIVTAMLGLFWFARIGVLDLTLVFVNPTYIVPQLLAGLLFGVGFVIGGLCPGTGVVAAATGKLDGVAVLLGLLAGIFLFGELFSGLTEFFYYTSMGAPTLPASLHLPRGIIILMIVLIALVGFAAAEALENKVPWVRKIMFWKGAPAGFTLHQRLAMVVVIPALLAVLVGDPHRTVGLPDSEMELMIGGEEVRMVAPREVAEWIMDKRNDFQLVDVRSGRAFRKYHLPFALHLPPEGLLEQGSFDPIKMVIYGQDATLPEESWQALRGRGV
ncbi:MAG: YeeE/YedE family protein, partial [Fidelibacterota bacterium]